MENRMERYRMDGYIDAKSLALLKSFDLPTKEECLQFVRAFHRKQHACGGSDSDGKNRVEGVLQTFFHRLFFWRDVPPVPEDKRVRFLK